MLKTIEGVYRDGKVKLTEVPKDVRDETRVLVTLLEAQSIDLRAGGIEISAVPKAAAPLKRTVPRCLCTTTTMPPMPIYQRGAALLALFPHSDLRTAKVRPALVVPAGVFYTGLHQVTVAMNASLLFRPNLPRRVVEVITGRALVLIADTVAPTGTKVNSQFSLVRVDGRK